MTAFVWFDRASDLLETRGRFLTVSTRKIWVCLDKPVSEQFPAHCFHVSLTLLFANIWNCDTNMTWNAWNNFLELQTEQHAVGMCTSQYSDLIYFHWGNNIKTGALKTSLPQQDALSWIRRPKAPSSTAWWMKVFYLVYATWHKTSAGLWHTQTKQTVLSTVLPFRPWVRLSRLPCEQCGGWCSKTTPRSSHWRCCSVLYKLTFCGFSLI